MDGLAGRRGTEDLLEAERRVEGRGPGDIGAEEDDLGLAEAPPPGSAPARSASARSNPAWAARSAASCSSASAWIALASNGFSARSEPSGVASSAATRSAVAESRSARGTTALARPRSDASRAPTNRPVAQISRARAYPTRCTSGPVPPRSGMSPSWASRIQSWASSASSRRSARQGQLEPCADRVALDRGDDDRRNRPPDGEPALEARDRGVEPVRDGQLEDVGLTGHTARREHLAVQSGGERGTLRADHHHPDLRRQRLPHLGQREPQRRRLGVARLGAREGQGEHRAVELDPDPRVDV